MTLASLDVALYTCLFLVPGFIIDEIVNAFSTSKKREKDIALLRYLMFSIVHVAMWSWAYVLLIKDIGTDIPAIHWVYLALLTVLGSFITGTIIGLLNKEQVLRNIFAKFSISYSSSIPTSWDSKFSSIEMPRWVIVAITGDKLIFGKFSKGACASSDPDERDIYLSKVYTTDEHNKWIEQPGTDGMLITKGQIIYIEFFHSYKEVEKELESGTMFRPSRKRQKELEAMIRGHKFLPPDVGTAAMKLEKNNGATQDDAAKAHGPIYDGGEATTASPKPNQKETKPKKKSEPIYGEPVGKGKNFVMKKGDKSAVNGPIYEYSPIYGGLEDEITNQKKSEKDTIQDATVVSVHGPIYDDATLKETLESTVHGPNYGDDTIKHK